ncbi:MAG TPA: hypothetical protein PLU22_02000 [Polyangiaceae bacterium]|nr:hypothetical protein [Polyangiaceae bacterium]
MRGSSVQLIVGAVSLGLVLGVTACKKKQDAQAGYPQAAYGAPQPGYGTATQPAYGTTPQPGYGTTTAPPGGTTAPGTTAPGTTAPGTTAPGTAAAGTCTEIDAAAAAAAQPIITAMSSGSVPAGAKPLGAVIAANCQAGGRISKPIQMQPGKCYTVVGAGVGVTELNMELKTVAVGGMAPVMSQDQETGSQAVIGKQPNCYKWAWPMGGTMNLDIIAAAGSGIVGAQVYEK